MRRRRCPPTVVYSKAHWENGAQTYVTAKLQGLDGGRSQKTHLYERAALLVERVVVLQLDRHRLVAVHGCHLYICGVVHEDGAEEVRGSEA